MANFTSEVKVINKPAHKIYDFLSNFKNFEHLMPEQVTNWEATETTCSFTVQGMADVGMKIKEKDLNTRVHIVSDGKLPFDFELTCHIEAIDENTSKAHIEINADLNPMMLMMVKRPLKNLVNLMAERLKHHHENEGGDKEGKEE